MGKIFLNNVTESSQKCKRRANGSKPNWTEGKNVTESFQNLSGKMNIKGQKLKRRATSPDAPKHKRTKWKNRTESLKNLRKKLKR